MFIFLDKKLKYHHNKIMNILSEKLVNLEYLKNFYIVENKLLGSFTIEKAQDSSYYYLDGVNFKYKFMINEIIDFCQNIKINQIREFDSDTEEEVVIYNI